MEILERIIYAAMVFIGIVLFVSDTAAFVAGFILMLGLLRMQDPFCKRD